jgi:hypothetical protein
METSVEVCHVWLQMRLAIERRFGYIFSEQKSWIPQEKAFVVSRTGIEHFSSAKTRRVISPYGRRCPDRCDAQADQEYHHARLCAGRARADIGAVLS